MSTAYPTPAVPEWIDAYLGPNFDPEYQYELRDKNGDLIWKSNKGPQTHALFAPCEELLVGGRRGGGKSKWLIARPAMGDPTLPEYDPAYQSYLLDSSYRALILREEYQSMADFVDEAVEFYKHFGGKPAGDPKYLKFESGARIYFNHLQNEESFNKYKGWNITFIGVEELTQIRTLKSYLKLLGSLRSVERNRVVRIDGKNVRMMLPGLRTQIASTTNPDGPGRDWVCGRFVYVLDDNGKEIPWNTPMRDVYTGAIRMFIPFPIEGNPFLSEDRPEGQRYRSMLMAQDEVTRKQWMEGDWRAGTGLFFTDYRPDGPKGEEEQTKFPWARHIIKSAPLKPWWYRWGSGDAGFQHPAAYHKAVRNEQDGRIHIYDEMQVRQIGSYEQGALLAQWWQQDLVALQAAGQDPCITVYMGADTFAKGDSTQTKAEQMVAGIRQVLGPYGGLLLKYNEEEQSAMIREPKRAQAMFERRRQELAGHMCIALKPIYFRRPDAWDYMADKLRFRPVLVQFQTDEDRDHYLREILAQEGRESYERHAADIKNVKPEVLPKVLIWECCRELDRCIRRAERDTSADGDPSRRSKSEDIRKFNADENGENGDDALESGRNLIVAYKEISVMMPLSYFVSERVSQIQKDHLSATGEELTDLTRLRMIAMTQTANWQKQSAPPHSAISFARAGSSRHRVQ
jgi:hypothetical protein